jgi:transient receptor potential cation channel subfamily V member 5
MNTKELCFQMDKCGAVGETLLHLCFLNATQVHYEIAKRLVKYYPKMVNDFYLSDEYFGKIFSDVNASTLNFL